MQIGPYLWGGDDMTQKHAEEDVLLNINTINGCYAAMSIITHRVVKYNNQQNHIVLINLRIA